jgi:hypothetical protein
MIEICTLRKCQTFKILFIQSKVTKLTHWENFLYLFVFGVERLYRKRPQIFDSSKNTYGGKVHFV